MGATFPAVAERVTVEHYRGNHFVREFQLTDQETGDPIDLGVGATAEFLILDSGDGSVLETYNVVNATVTVTPASGTVAISGAKLDPAWTENDFTLTVTFGSGREVTYLFGSFVLLDV